MISAALANLDKIVGPAIQEVLFPYADVPKSGDFRVLVTGWRDWPEECSFVIENVLWMVFQEYFQVRHHGSRMVVVDGACIYGGVDLYAHRWAERTAAGLIAPPEPADLVVSERHPAVVVNGKVQGAPRNTKMVNLGAELCLSFPNDKFFRNQGGTYDCTMKAIQAGIPTWTFFWNDKYRDLILGVAR